MLSILLRFKTFSVVIVSAELNVLNSMYKIENK